MSVPVHIVQMLKLTDTDVGRPSSPPSTRGLDHLKSAVSRLEGEGAGDGTEVISIKWSVPNVSLLAV